MTNELNSLIIQNPKRAGKGKHIGSIYVLVNTVNGKLYIGQTKQYYQKRWQDHKDQSKKSRHLISRAIKKYGFENFQKYVIYQTDEVDDKNKLIDILDFYEKKYIDQFNTTDHTIGYNVSTGGNGPCGYHLTKEQRKKISDTHKGKFNNPNRCEKIYQYDFEFNLIKIWPSNAEIKRQLGSQIEFGNNKFTFYNSIWIRERDHIDGCLEKYKSRVEQLKLLKTSKAVSCKWILQFDFLGNLINKFPSARYAASQINVDRSMISGAANGKHKQAKGFVWIYENDFSEDLLKQKIENCKNSVFYKKFIKNKESNT